MTLKYFLIYIGIRTYKTLNITLATYNPYKKKCNTFICAQLRKRMHEGDIQKGKKRTEKKEMSFT